MTDEKLDQPRNITLLPYQMQSGESIKQENQSDIQVYKEILLEKFALAKRAEEYEILIDLRQKLHELDRKERQLNYTQQSAEVQLQKAQEKDIFQRNQQMAASVFSVGIGVLLIQTVPLAGLLFLILGLAKPLGYSLGEIGDFLDGLKGFSKDSNEVLYNGKDKDNQSEEQKNGRS